MPDVTIVKAGTLDDVELLNGMAPGMEIHTEVKVRWMPKLAEVAKEGME